MGKKRRKKWVDFVWLKRAKGEPSQSLVLCSEHFKREDFSQRIRQKSNRRRRSQRVNLPSISTTCIFQVIMCLCLIYIYVRQFWAITILTRILSSRYNFPKTCFGMTHAIISFMCCSVFHCSKYVYSLSTLII